MEAIREENEVSDAALLAKFMDDMMPTKLLCRKPIDGSDLFWVFWSHEPIDSDHTSTNQGIQDRIKIALSNLFSVTEGKEGLLVQFWAAKMIGGRRHLTTTLQPFALRNLRNEKLNEYRKHCVGYKFLFANVENDGNLSMDGIVGRVFRNQLPECCGDPRNYSPRDYPQRDLALSCGIKSSVAFPLFEVESSGLDYCVGVLELLFTPSSFAYLYWYSYVVNAHLQDVGLRTIEIVELQSQIKDLYRGPIQNEIKAALKQVCKKYDLSRALTWVSYGRNMSCKDSRESFQGELLFPSPAMSIFPPSVTMKTYFDCALLLRQGLAAKAFLYNNPYFCRDMSKLSMSDHLLAQMARDLRLASCFIVCLRNISTGKHEFVIKFFPHKRYRGDIVTLFSSIQATMKQQLKTFEVVTDPQNEFFIEVHEFGESFVKASTGKCKSVIYKEQSNGTFTSYKTLSAPTTSDEEHTETEYSYKTLSAPTTSDEEHTETEYSYRTLSAPTTLDEEHTETEYSSYSIHSTESTSNSRYGIHVRTSFKRIKHVCDHLDQVTLRYILAGPTVDAVENAVRFSNLITF